jgi:hypothetical protein
MRRLFRPPATKAECGKRYDCPGAFANDNCHHVIALANRVGKSCWDAPMHEAE